MFRVRSVFLFKNKTYYYAPIMQHSEALTRSKSSLFGMYPNCSHSLSVISKGGNLDMTSGARGPSSFCNSQWTVRVFTTLPQVCRPMLPSRYREMYSSLTSSGDLVSTCLLTRSQLPNPNFSMPFKS